MMLSLGQFHKVVEMLYSMRCFDRAACFIEACIEFGVLAKTNDTGTNSILKQSPFIFTFQNVFREVQFDVTDSEFIAESKYLFISSTCLKYECS